MHDALLCDRLLRPQQNSVTVLGGMHGPEITTAVSELVTSAISLAHRLKALGIGSGDRAAILMPTGPASIIAILASWHARAAFSMLPWAVGSGGSKIAIQRLYQALDALQPKVVLVAASSANIIDQSRFPSARILLVEFPDHRFSGSANTFHCQPDDLAFIQFTSGSTDASAKGVIVRHAQLADNIVGIGEKIQVKPTDVMVSWAPLHHDMGLVALLLSLFYGLSLVLIPTESFGRRPAIWLEAIDRFRGTLSPAPPFAFQLLAKRPALRNRKLDLSSWRYAWVGAEPIFPSQLLAFENVYRQAGLRENVLQGTYGLAESVVVVSNGQAGQPRLTLAIDSVLLRETGQVAVCERPSPGAIEVVSCGSPNRNMEVRIADEAGNMVGEGVRGRILIRGPSVTEGYFGHLDRRSAHEWLDTGDLGFLFEGQIFVIGRTKDLVKRAGVGVAPQEIEWVVEQTLGLKTGRAAAFSYLRPERSKEEIVVLVEDRVSRHEDNQLVQRVVSAVALDVGVQIDALRFVGLNAIPRTSSGKLRRNEARELFLAGKYDNADASSVALVQTV
ncbi:MAG: AMP-binding protein [Roseiarcus sp.]|jgi:acyl-CoA synthetase (AMP-forming)/AMP-acid ligase II